MNLSFISNLNQALCTSTTNKDAKNVWLLELGAQLAIELVLLCSISPKGRTFHSEIDFNPFITVELPYWKKSQISMKRRY